MRTYDVTWTKLDAGREGLWADPCWRGVIEIAAKYDGQDVYKEQAPIYDDLKRVFPETTWKNYTGGSFHPVFRDYLHPWKFTRTLEVNDGILRLTPLARKLLSGEITEADVFLQMFQEYEENGERPFKILATAFLKTNKPLSIRDLYLGVMQGFRPGDDIEGVLQAIQSLPPLPDTQKTRTELRRLRLMIRLLERIGAIISWDETWVPWNKALLQKIAYSSVTVLAPGTTSLKQMPNDFERDMALANLHYDVELVRRYCAALLAKPFVILTGLSGSGKTKLALAFASWITSSKSQYAIIPVGADWTSREPILGYADALDPKKYVRTQALDLILRAEQEPNSPFFLILDEMNLSHVERYFADLLSAIESEEEIWLYNKDDELRDGVPSFIQKLPLNLFVIGTINVDETTYMFSPKVLDRANAIEFRVGSEEMEQFLNNPQDVDLDMLSRSGVQLAEAVVTEAKSEAVLEYEDKQALECELLLFFDVLRECRAEFGFRTAHEIARFVSFHKKLTDSGWEFKAAMDAQILQKLLPRLQGSRKKLEPVLWALATLCYQEHSCNSQGQIVTSDGSDLREEVKKAIRLKVERDPFRKDDKENYFFHEEKAHYPLSYRKILRMLSLLEQGFTSFAEA